MTRAYGTPELLEVGGLEEMVLGDKDLINQPDCDQCPPFDSSTSQSVLDVD